MNARKIAGVTFAAVTSLGLTTACSDGWFGVQPDPSPVAETCANLPRAANPPSDVAVQGPIDGWKRRPSDVTPGNNWILIGVHVVALDPMTGAPDMCVPIHVHIELDVMEEDALINGADAPRVYDIDGVTPWVRHYVPLDYSPNDPRFRARPPNYRIRASAEFIAEWAKDDRVPQQLGCSLTIWDGTVASGTQVPPGPVDCVLYYNQFDRYDQYGG